MHSNSFTFLYVLDTLVSLRLRSLHQSFLSFFYFFSLFFRSISVFTPSWWGCALLLRSWCCQKHYLNGGLSVYTQPHTHTHTNTHTHRHTRTHTHTHTHTHPHPPTHTHTHTHAHTHTRKCTQ